MAVPVVLRNSDYSSVDFSNKSQGGWEVFKDALINKLGWNLEFEDTTTDKILVASNQGSGYMIKIYTGTDSNGIYFETAQSWSDINTPVNKLVEQYVRLTEIDDNFVIIGTSKCFYFSSRRFISNIDSEGVLIFVGDYKSFKETDSNVFIFTGQTTSTVSTSAIASSSTRGVLIDNVNVADVNFNNKQKLFEFFGDENGGSTPIDGSFYSPGAIPLVGSNVKVDQINQSILTYMSPVFIVNADVYEPSNTTIQRGLFPGARMIASQSKKVFDNEFFSQIEVSGVNLIALQAKRYSAYPVFFVSLNDWDL